MRELVSVPVWGDALVPAGQFLVVINSVTSGVGALLGGLVARARFMPLALAVGLMEQAALIWVLYSIAEPAGEASVVAIVSSDALLWSASLVATVAGVALGQWLSQRFCKRTACATPT